MSRDAERIIYLAWRPTEHQPRYIIGELLETAQKTYEFYYIFGSDLDAAKRLGFIGYPAFPIEEKIYRDNVIETFAIRLPARSRQDFEGLLDFWNIQNKDISDFDLLGITGGQLATDYFEFIDPHVNRRPNSFLTELAGFSHYLPDQELRKLRTGAIVDLVPEPTNIHDVHAIRVIADAKHIGYIKKIHSNTIAQELQRGANVTANIQRIQANGIVNTIILNIALPAKISK